MNGSYEFLTDLRRLTVVYRRLEKVLYLLNAAIITILIYAIELYLGIPAFFRFYWQDSAFLAESPAVISAILGIIAAQLLKKRLKSNFFQLLGQKLAEKTKTAYDNRYFQSIIMQNLAEDVKRLLSQVSAFDLVKARKIALKGKSVPVLYLKSAVVVVFLGGIIVFSQSQIGEEISPADFQTLMDIKDRATELVQDEEDENIGPSDEGLSGEIYGKPSLAVLEEVNLELLLVPGSGAGLRAKETEPAKYLFQDATPGEGVAVPTELYIESLPPQHREIIKRYFEILAKD